MARITLPTALKLTFGHEGGLSTDRADPGNWSTGKVNKGVFVGTKYGITGRVLGAHRGLDRSATFEEVKALTLKEAEKIYRSSYWGAARCDEMPAGLDYAVFDFAVNSGVSRAVRSLQRVLGVKQDGVVGRFTLQAIAKRDVIQIIRDYIDERMRFLKTLRNWKDHGRGWTIRVIGQDPRGVFKSRKGVLGEALELAKWQFPEPSRDPISGSAKADESNVSAASLPETKATGLAAVGAAAAAAAEAVSDVDALRYVFLALVIVGVGITAYLAIKRSRE